MLKKERKKPPATAPLATVSPPAPATLLFLTVSARRESPPAIVTPSRRHSCGHRLCAHREARLWPSQNYPLPSLLCHRRSSFAVSLY
ncbi:hypothetical protein Ahy_A02g006391 isoform I [Arachis hypogaea]|uniref:Uncharacterized protein n=1 Tax=Arachis hypogaea TaxID=3818 RepID=A0A445E9S7_ARAHY|nr:hypothetical protein Ahy_A02g006391 isoform I [Arachis hypogaea]